MMNEFIDTVRYLTLPLKLRKAIVEANRLGEAGQYEEAFEEIASVAYEYPNHWIGFLTLWVCAFQAEEYRAAAGAAFQMLRLEPNGKETLMCAVRAFEEVNFPNKACLALGNLLDRYPNAYDDPKIEHGWRVKQLDWSKDAVATFGGRSVRSALERGSLYEDGLIEMMSFAYEDAILIFERLLTQVPDCTRVRYKLATCYFEIYQYDKAFVEIGRCLKKEPGNIVFRCGEVRLLKVMDKPFNREIQIVKSIQIDDIFDIKFKMLFIFNECDDSDVLKMFNGLKPSTVRSIKEDLFDSDILHMVVEAMLGVGRPEAEVMELARYIRHEWSGDAIPFGFAHRIPRSAFGADGDEEEET